MLLSRVPPRVGVQQEPAGGRGCLGFGATLVSGLHPLPVAPQAQVLHEAWPGKCIASCHLVISCLGNGSC